MNINKLMTLTIVALLAVPAVYAGPKEVIYGAANASKDFVVSAASKTKNLGLSAASKAKGFGIEGKNLVVSGLKNSKNFVGNHQKASIGIGLGAVLGLGAGLYYKNQDAVNAKIKAVAQKIKAKTVSLKNKFSQLSGKKKAAILTGASAAVLGAAAYLFIRNSVSNFYGNQG